jgi:hypothetical protein
LWFSRILILHLDSNNLPREYSSRLSQWYCDVFLARQGEVKACPLAFLALHPHPAAMPMNDPLDVSRSALVRSFA